MPQYLFLLYDREDLWVDVPPEEWSDMMRRHGAFQSAVQAADGATILGSSALRPQATATTIRTSSPGSTPLVTGGPFLEAKEALGGYYLFECPDLDQALELAGQCPVQSGGVEVRPIWDVTGS